MKKKLKTLIVLGVSLCVILGNQLLAFAPRQRQSLPHKGIVAFAVLRDPSGNLTLSEAKAAGERFKTTNASVYNLPPDGSVYWLRLRLDTTSAISGSRYLQVANNNIDSLTVYYPGRAAMRTGKEIPSRALELRTLNEFFRIPQTLRVTDDVYVRVRNSSNLLLPLSVVSEVDLISGEQSRNLFLGLIFGMLLAIFFVNCCAFLVLRNPEFWSFALYLLGLIAHQAGLQGYLRFIPMSPFLFGVILWVSLAVCELAKIAFAREFLGLRGNRGGLNTALRTLDVAVVAQTTIAIFVSVKAATILACATGLFLSIAILTKAIGDFLQGKKGSGIFTMACIPFLGGILVCCVSPLFPPKIRPVHFLFAGSILDAILLTVAVFDVIRRELHEKEAALAREKYYIDLSRTDALTGLYNRRHLSETVKRMETERSMPIVTTLIMIDIDNFKVINDTYGHQVGDSILAAVGKHIRGRIRKSDIACRYGGDEFLLILPGGGQESAMRICEGIKEDLQENDFRSESGERVVVTLSVGITESRLEDSFDGMFLRADAALYQAKKTGRARVAVL